MLRHGPFSCLYCIAIKCFCRRAACLFYFIREGIKSGGAMSHDITPPVIFMRTNLCVLNLLYNCLESGGVVESEVGKHLTVDLYA